jgi:hypothetical protein
LGFPTLYEASYLSRHFTIYTPYPRHYTTIAMGRCNSSSGAQYKKRKVLDSCPKVLDSCPVCKKRFYAEDPSWSRTTNQSRRKSKLDHRDACMIARPEEWRALKHECPNDGCTYNLAWTSDEARRIHIDVHCHHRVSASDTQVIVSREHVYCSECTEHIPVGSTCVRSRYRQLFCKQACKHDYRYNGRHKQQFHARKRARTSEDPMIPGAALLMYENRLDRSVTHIHSHFTSL